MSNIKHISTSGDNEIFTINCIAPNGQDAWYILQVTKIKAPIFTKNAKAGNVMDLKQFGKILHSGYGKQVPDDIINQYK